MERLTGCGVKVILLMAFICFRNTSALDFDQSMQLDAYGQALQLSFCQHVYEHAKQLYERYNLDAVMPAAHAKIPKVIHHVWFGASLSEEDTLLRKTWEDKHPEWRFILWTDRPSNDSRGVVVTSWEQIQNVLYLTDERYITVDVSDLKFDNRCYFDEARNYGEKSDIIKWELVYRLGGVYVDCDFECLRSLDDLHTRYDFYTGMQPLDTNAVQLGAALFAAWPQHPILRHCVETIASSRHHPQIVIRTGPIHFTCAFVAQAGHGTVDVALPASYFYPCGYTQHLSDRASWLKEESYAVHHWAGGWLKPEAFQER